MSRLVERCWPAFLAGSFTLALYLTLTPDDRVKIASELSNSVLNVFAIMVGFIATALALLVTAQDIQAIQRLRLTPHFNHLVDYHWVAVCFGLGASALSLVVTILCKTSVVGTLPLVFFHAWVYASVGAFTTFFRVVQLLRTLLRMPPPAPASPPLPPPPTP